VLLVCEHVRRLEWIPIGTCWQWHALSLELLSAGEHGCRAESSVGGDAMSVAMASRHLHGWRHRIVWLLPMGRPDGIAATRVL